MDFQVALTCLLIIAARIGDVSLGVLRTVCVFRGHRGLAFVLGFFEVLIWVFAVSKVIQNLTHPAYALSYALGFALGTYVGLSIEQWLAYGEQAVLIFTRQGPEVAARLRDAEFRATEFDGIGRDGPVYLLFVQVPRRMVQTAIDRAQQIDPACYYLINDVRSVSAPLLTPRLGNGWRSALKK